jgi:CelD/BcsL family acetyltransferase involved in cellulose biosynthesis
VALSTLAMACPLKSQPTLEAVYQGVVIREVESFRTLQAEWDTLLGITGEANMSLEHRWLLSWLENFSPSQLCVILVKDSQGNLVGAAPLKISRSPSGAARRLLRQLQFIGSDPCVYDWTKILIHPGANETEVLSEVARQILGMSSEWDVLDLRFCSDLRQLEKLSGFLSPACHELTVTPTMSMPFLKLPRPAEGYEALKPARKFVKDLQRVRNGLERDFPGLPLALVFVDGSPQNAAVLDEFFDDHIAYWASRGSRSDLQRFPKLRQFYQSIFSKDPSVTEVDGHVIFSMLKLGDEILSTHFGFFKGNGYLGHLSTYNAAYKKYRPGVLHMDALIRRMIDREAQRFDFGRGDESYKSSWAQSTMPLFQLIAFSNPWSAFQWRLDDHLKQWFARRKSA